MSLLMHFDIFRPWRLNMNMKYHVKPLSRANQSREIDCKQIGQTRLSKRECRTHVNVKTSALNRMHESIEVWIEHKFSKIYENISVFDNKWKSSHIFLESISRSIIYSWHC